MVWSQRRPEWIARQIFTAQLDARLGASSHASLDGVVEYDIVLL
jgi:hypothetical protein